MDIREPCEALADPRSVRSVCVKESKISVNKIFVLFVRFVCKKDIRGFLSKDP